MIRSLIIYIFGGILLSMSSMFQEGGVTVSMDAPSSVSAGSSFTVRLLFKKKDIQSFSRFYQDIPAGLKVASVQTANGDFSFQDNRIRMVWFRLPSTDTFSVVYAVQVDERLKGTFTLHGTFSYIDNNERKSVKIPPREIRIIPSSNIDPKLIVDIRDFGKRLPVGEMASSSGSDIFCLRSFEPVSGATGEMSVTFLIHKRNLTSFGKLEDTIPAGFIAIPGYKKDALFTYREGVAKFLWMNLPPDAWFTVSYKLVPQVGARAGAPVIHGTFAFVSNNKTMVIPVTDAGQNLAEMNKNELSALVANRLALIAPAARPAEEMKKQDLAQAQAQTKTQKQILTQPQAQTSVLPSSGAKPVVPEVAKTTTKSPKKSPSPKTVPISGKALSGDIPMAYTLKPETGLYYRVQLAAGHRLVNIPGYFRKMNISEEIRVEKHEGWYKYSVGSFLKYQDALACRDHIRSATPVKDAFVAAYNNGKRITVQEALMIIRNSAK